MNVGRVNVGTLALRTARAMHEPAGVPAKGGATLAVVTRPEFVWVPRRDSTVTAPIPARP